MANFINSDFSTGTGGADLSTFTGSLGETYSRHPGFSSAAAVLTTSSPHRVRASSVQVFIVYLASPTPPVPDYNVVGTFYNAGSAGNESYSDQTGIQLRSDPTADTEYRCYYSAGNFIIDKRVGGSNTRLGIVGGPILPAGAFTLTADVTGTTITFSYNGAAQLTVTDPDITVANKVAVFLYRSGATIDDTTGVHLSSLVATGTATPPPTVTYTVDNVAFFFSPYNWRLSGSTYAETNNLGAYFKIRFTGTSARVLMDVSNQVAAALSDYPWVCYSVDGGPVQDVHLSSGTTGIDVATGLSAGTHTLLFFYRSNLFPAESWASFSNAIRVTGLQVDEAATVSAPTLRSKRLLVFGDSITAGGRARDASDTAASADALFCYAADVAYALDAEVGVVAFGGQGWESQGTGGVPAFPSAWNLYSSGHSRLSGGLLSPAPDYILVNMGTNGATVEADVSAWIPAIRTAAPLAKIFMLIPFNTSGRAAIIAGVAAAADGNVKVIDGGAAAAEGVSGGGASLTSTDGAHPNQYGHARLGALVAKMMQAQLSTGGSGGGCVVLM